jgi:hypothetical protein
LVHVRVSNAPGQSDEDAVLYAPIDAPDAMVPPQGSVQSAGAEQLPYWNEPDREPFVQVLVSSALAQLVEMGTL